MKKKIQIILAGLLLVLPIAFALPVITLNSPSSSPFYTMSNFLKINSSISDPSLGQLKYNWNGTNFTIYDKSLFLMYNFDNLSKLGENGTLIADASLAGKNTTNINGPVWNSSGKYGGAMQFDGVDDYINVTGTGGYDFVGKPFTVSLWIKTDNLTQNGRPICMHNNAHPWRSWDFNIKNNEAVFLTYDTSVGDPYNAIEISSQISANKWTLLTASYDMSSTRLYINGVFKNSSVIPGPLFDSTDGIRFGTLNSDGLYKGFIDEARIWNRTLSNPEINQMYFMNLQRFNQTEWRLISNQSKNTTSGLGFGTYTYQEFASSISGSTNSTGQRTAIILADSMPPTAMLKVPSQGQGFKLAKTIIFNVSATDNYGLRNCTLWTNITGGWARNSTKRFTGMSDYNDSWAYVLPVKSYKWNVLCCDNQSNCAWNSTNRTFKVNAWPNSNFSETLTAGTSFFIGQKIEYTLNVTSHDSYNLTIIQVNGSFNSPYLGYSSSSIANNSGDPGKFSWADITGSSDLGPNHSIILKINMTSNALNPNANLTITINATNKDNDSGISAVLKTVSIADTTAPSVMLKIPTAGQLFSATKTVRFNITTTDNYGLRNCTLWTNVTGSWAMNSTKRFTGMSDFNDSWIFNLAAKSYKWNVQCCDNQSNCAWNSTNRTFRVSYVDSMPSVSFNSPINNYNSSNTAITFSCNASGANLKNVSLFLNASSWKQNQTNTSGLSASYRFQKTIQQGSYKWNCRACDNAGNCTFAGVNRTLRIDTTAPTILGKGKNSSATLSNSTYFKITSNITDNYKISSVTVHYGSNTAIAMALSNGNYSAITTPYALGITNSGTGLSLNISACDFVENCNSALLGGINVSINSALSIAISNPAAKIYDSRLNFTGMIYSSALNTSSCLYNMTRGSTKIANTAILSPTFAGGNNYSFKITYIDQGRFWNLTNSSKYNITISCRTIGGVKSVSKREFTVDDIMPPSLGRTISVTPSTAVFTIYDDGFDDFNYTLFYFRSTSLSLNYSSSSEGFGKSFDSFSIGNLVSSTTYNYTITSCDRTRNCNTTPVLQFTTNAQPTQTGSPGGGGGGGGGGGISKGLKNATGYEFNYAILDIAAGITWKKDIKSNNLAITGFEINPKKDKKQISVSITQLYGRPEFSNLPDNAFKYAEINLTGISNTEINNATIYFKTPKLWLDNYSINPGDIYLERYYGSSWYRLDTSMIRSDDAYYYYSAVTTGFSYFAITGDKSTPVVKNITKEIDKNLTNMTEIKEITVENSTAEPIEEVKGENNTINPPNTPVHEKTKISLKIFLLPLVIIILFIIIGILLFEIFRVKKDTKIKLKRHEYSFSEIKAGKICHKDITDKHSDVAYFSFMAKKNLSEANVHISQIDPSHPSIGNMGLVFKFITIKIRGISKEDYLSSSVTFKIPKKWVDSNKIDFKSLDAKFYHDNHWIGLNLQNSYLGQNFYYLNYNVPMFGHFIISGKFISKHKDSESR